MEKLEKILSPMANYLNNNKVIQAISKGIMSTMAALMVGAAGSILLNLPIDAYQSFITSCGLNNVFNTLVKYSLQGTTQGRYLTGGVPPVRFSM